VSYNAFEIFSENGSKDCFYACDTVLNYELTHALSNMYHSVTINEECVTS